MAVPAYAQAVSSSIRGEIVSALDGTLVQNAEVEIIDTRTNSRTRQFAPNGQFNASGLDVGGPYTIRVSAPGFKDREITGVFLTLGEPVRLVVDMESQQTAERVTVVGTRGNAKIDSRGTGDSFNERAIRDAPVLNNDFKEIISQSPLATHELAGSGNNVLLSTQQLTIAGTNPRCNSFNIDGVSQNDSFGLNNGGYPTARAPLPTQWAKQVQLAVSPYDTEYNDFCGGVINVITKSGSNEFHGGMYYNFKDQDLRGKDIGNGTSPNKVDFQEENWGAHLSGPIIKDTLFFFAGYNRILRTGATSDFGPFGSGAANVVGTVTQQELDDIINISKTIYDYDPGGTASSAPEDIQNHMAKLNWNISDNHRVQYTYQYSKGGANQAGSTPSFNAGGGADASGSIPQRLALSSTRYFDGEELESHNFQFFNNWTDRFSTEVKLGRIFVVGNQIPLMGADMPTILVQADYASNPDSASYTGGDGYVILGPDNSRHYNFLEYTANVAKVTATYDMDDHVIKAGYEKKTLDIFNAFVQTADAMYRFDCISDNVAGNANCFDEGAVALFGDPRFGSNSATVPVNSVTYQNNPSNDPAAAAAIWGYNIDTLYAQDDWSINSNLAVLFGLRYDRFDSKGDIHVNPGFTAAHGFDNTKDLDGLDIVLPRASFAYELPAETEEGLDMTFRGGVGRYSGGAPNVWISNNYSNDGMQQVLLTGIPGSGPLAGLAADFLTTGPGGLANLEDVHPDLQSLLSGLSSNGTVNALAPDFKLPSIWRANLALDARWQGWEATIEYLHTEAVDQLYYQDLRMVPIGVGPDGRVIYDHITTVDPTKVRPNGNDLILANADGGSGKFIMAGIGKQLDIDEGRGDVRIRFDYIHSDVEDLGGLTSSVAFSNFAAQAKNSMNEPELGRSSYEREHIFKLRASAGYRFFEFLESRLSMFGMTMSGQGVSYTFQGNPFVDNINAASNPGGVNQTYNDNQPGGRALLYVPQTNAAGQIVCGTDTATSSDPKVFFAAGFNCAGFNDYLRSQGLLDYAGGIAPRNFRDSPDISRIDLAFEQELNFFDDHRAVLEINIFNFTNLLNRKWGLWQTPVFQNVQQVVNANYDRETDTYRFNSFQTGNGLQISTEASQWQAQVGFRYEF